MIPGPKKQVCPVEVSCITTYSTLAPNKFLHADWGLDSDGVGFLEAPTGTLALVSPSCGHGRAPVCQWNSLVHWQSRGPCELSLFFYFI